MTLNASWMARLTLRSQVIRETKGQAKQEEDPQPQLPRLRVPFPPVREGGQMHSGSEPHSPHASALSAWQCRAGGGRWSRWVYRRGGGINRDVCLWLLLNGTNPAEVNVGRKLTTVWRKHSPEPSGGGRQTLKKSSLEADDGQMMIVFLYI